MGRTCLQMSRRDGDLRRYLTLPLVGELFTASGALAVVQPSYSWYCPPKAR